MENFARVVFTIVFITILVGVIVAFSLFAIAPAEKIVRVFTGGFGSEGEPAAGKKEALSGGVESVSRQNGTETGGVPAPSSEPPSPPAPSVPEPGSPENPQQSSPVTESQVPADAVKLTMNVVGFSPSRFTIRAGRTVSLSVSSGDQTHVFKFENPSLSQVAIGVGPGETRYIEFYAPSVPGEYTFYCDVPGHRARGEEGVMVVE